MVGYLYHITNQINNKTYIGKTNDIDRKRVGRIIKKETYIDFIKNWEERQIHK